ncbi:MAG: hypothetical protein LBO03_09230 [Acidaminococcales bacterium]|jgi:hypothetical protein|nr:hypothetical protein [Acidaminococcales bacterium]
MDEQVPNAPWMAKCSVDKRLIKRYNIIADIRGPLPAFHGGAAFVHPWTERLATLILNLGSRKEVVFVKVYEALSLAIALATLVVLIINGK